MREPAFEKQLITGDPVSAIDALTRHGLLFTGTVKNTMTRDEGYTFLHLGKFLERAIVTSDILRINLSAANFEFDPAVEAPGLRYLLYSLFGFETYMKTYKGNFNIEQVLELIIYNTFFPHSLMYSLNQLHRYFERLKPDSLPENFEELEYIVGKTMNNVKYSYLQPDNRQMINSFLLNARKDLRDIGAAFSKHYFGNT
jgi:uncharacterized alpha-E superfamily protein